MNNNIFQFKFLMSRDDAQVHWLKARRSLGAWLNEFRREQNLNLSDVADSTSLPITTLDDYESGMGKITLDRLLYICRFYGAKIDVSLSTDDDIDYDRSAELAQAKEFRQAQPKEIDNVK